MYYMRNVWCHLLLILLYIVSNNLLLEEWIEYQQPYTLTADKFTI